MDKPNVNARARLDGLFPHIRSRWGQHSSLFSHQLKRGGKVQQKSVTVTPSGMAKKCPCKRMAYIVSL